MKNLAAFDFDHTIVEENSDIVVADLIKGGIPLELNETRQKDSWTNFMQGIFDKLHDQGTTEDDIKNAIGDLKPVDGMPNLICELSTNLNCDVIIISDSNSYFIDCWLRHNNLKHFILKEFTNPAEFVNGHLKIEMYHVQDYCEFSSINLCKGQVLLDFIERQKKNNVNYSTILYSGDGANDFCPILKLSKHDHAFVRSNFKCVDMVQKSRRGEIKNNSGVCMTVQANIHIWQSGFDILEIVQNIAK